MYCRTSHSCFALLVLLHPLRLQQLPRQCNARDRNMSDELCPTVWCGCNNGNGAGQNKVTIISMSWQSEPSLPSEVIWVGG